MKSNHLRGGNQLGGVLIIGGAEFVAKLGGGLGHLYANPGELGGKLKTPSGAFVWSEGSQVSAIRFSFQRIGYEISVAQL